MHHPFKSVLSPHSVLHLWGAPSKSPCYFIFPSFHFFFANKLFLIVISLNILPIISLEYAKQVIQCDIVSEAKLHPTSWVQQAPPTLNTDC